MRRTLERRFASPGPQLKTCETCFHAKIRCDKTQDSGVCDRCLRLGKTCEFKQSRRQARPRPAANKAPLRDSDENPGQPMAAPSEDAEPRPRASAPDPFSIGLLSARKGQELLDTFTSNMADRFPFVVFEKDTPVHALFQRRPYACLALLAVSCHHEVQLQMRLGRLFNRAIADRMNGMKSFADLDLLQGLLVYLAWAHFHPQPRMYSQHLYLAASIVCDLRLDREKNPTLWDVHSSESCGDGSGSGWRPEEMRAYLGTYYLASSISTILQKNCRVPWTPHVDKCCQRLAELKVHWTDTYVPHLISVQRYTEEVEDLASRGPSSLLLGGTPDGIETPSNKYRALKDSLDVSFSGHPLFPMHSSFLELLLCQSSPLDGALFNLAKFAEMLEAGNAAPHTGWLFELVSTLRSLLNVMLVLAPGAESLLTNIEWIMLYCGLSMAAKLDVSFALKGQQDVPQQLRRVLDFGHAIKQTIIRLEAASGPSKAQKGGDEAPFHGLLRRVKALAQWHGKQVLRHSPATPSNTNGQSGPDSGSFDGQNLADMHFWNPQGGIMGTFGLPLGDLEYSYAAGADNAAHSDTFGHMLQ